MKLTSHHQIGDDPARCASRPDGSQCLRPRGYGNARAFCAAHRNEERAVRYRRCFAAESSVHFRVSAAEKEHWQRVANSLGMSLSMLATKAIDKFISEEAR